MSSILKVDQLQDSGGNEIITSNGSGTITVNNQTFKNGITVADQFRLTATTNNNTNADVTSNWERVDNTGWSGIGTGLTESSGIFSFPQTGIYLITFQGSFTVGANDSFASLQLKITTDNSSYTDVARSGVGNRATNGASVEASSSQFIFDITNITTHKFKFTTTNFTTNTELSGNTDINTTAVLVMRIGDT